MTDNEAAVREEQPDQERIEQLNHLHELWEQGILTEAEFVAEKNQLLGT
jgi:hypothetical protein